MPIEIVKVKVVGDHIVVYNKTRTKETSQPLLNYVKEKLKGDSVAFFNGAWSSIVGWGISERVPDQDW